MQSFQNNGCVFLIHTDWLLQNAFSKYKTKIAGHAAQLETIASSVVTSEEICSVS